MLCIIIIGVLIMVNGFVVEHWVCSECGESHDYQEAADECCGGVI
jgi:hypothetical protein